MSKKFGFTLIELMVVVFIVALLASLVVVNVNQARKKARDAKRIADLNTVATALQAFYADHHYYPGYDFYGCPDPSDQYFQINYPQSKWFYIVMTKWLTGRKPQQPTQYLVSCPKDPFFPPWSDSCSYTDDNKVEHLITDSVWGSTQYGYRYSAWPPDSGVCENAVHFGLATVVEIESNATLRSDTPSGKPEYRICDGEPDYGHTICTP